MAVKKIFVNPGDLITIHVINDPDLPKNAREWIYSSPNPYKISMTAGRYSVTFHDPCADIYLQQGSHDTKTPLLPVTSPQREVDIADVLAWADGIMGALGTEHASKVTDEEARIAWAITNAPR